MVKLIDSVDKINAALNAELKNVEAEEVIFSLNINKYTEPVTRALMRCVEKYMAAGYKPVLKIQVNGLDYVAEDFENIIDLEYVLSSKDVCIKFSEHTEEYTIEEALNAYLKCTDFANYVNSTNASPLEKYLMIYRYLTSMVYKENLEHPLKARQIISVLNSDDIVCVGYSKLMKYLCNAVGIKCETQMLRVYTKGESRVGIHQNNIIYLKDEKYGIDGFYYADSCWDSIKRRQEPFIKYNYALLPIKDVSHFKGKRMEFYPDTAALYDDKIFEDILLSTDARKECSKKFGFEFKKESLPEFFRDANSTGSKIVKTANMVKQIFLENGVPADYLSKKYRECSPTCFYPELFIALMLVEPPETEMFNYYLEQLKTYAKHEVAINDEIPFTKYQHAYGYEDIYEEFDKFVNGDFNFNIWDISDYYESIEYTKQFSKFINNARISSIPIGVDIIEMAIRESLLKEGWEQLRASNEAHRAIVNSEKRAEKIFDYGASNCFSCSALQKRKLNGRIY